MKLDNEQLYDFFSKQGIQYLYHANTVATSITFLQQKGLLSRGAVENRGLFQTKQESDEKDRKFNVWDDIFLDTIDLHGFFPRQNLYGPISFRFNCNFILDSKYEIWVTKSNPIHWTEESSDEEKYFTSIDELKKNWLLIPRQRMMITLKNNSAPVLFDSLDKITVDNPRVKINDLRIYEQTVTALEECIDESFYDLFARRVCNTKCYCTDNYLYSTVDKLKRLFFPKELLT